MQIPKTIRHSRYTPLCRSHFSVFFIANNVVYDALVPIERFWFLSRRYLKYLQLENVSLEPERSLSKGENTNIYKIHTDINKRSHFQSQCTEGHLLHNLEIGVVSQSSSVDKVRLPHLLEKLFNGEYVRLRQLRI